MIKKSHVLGVLLFLAVLSLLSCGDRQDQNSPALKQQLELLGFRNVVEINAPDGYRQAFRMDIVQPVDHHDPCRGTFLQRLYLSFRNREAPTVFYTTGYGVDRNGIAEPSWLLKANQILLVHRYFPDAVPTDDWQFLTIEQAAADQHRIRQRLRLLLSGKWVTSGGSKGGMTALYYRYYYPDDVDATIAYVAPIMERTEDVRFVPFLQQVGTDDCRRKIRLFQREVLTRRAAMLALTHADALENHYMFTVFSEEQALEYAVIDYDFAFWQYGLESDCASIPDANATDRDIFDHLNRVSPVSTCSDADYDYFRPFYYQAYTEIGYYAFDIEHLIDLLSVVTEPSGKDFAPRDVELTFQPEVMQRVVPWLRTRGERILYLYGGNDPWTAAALNPEPGLDALQIIQPGANHQTQIKDLDQKDLAIRTLARWLDLDLDAEDLAQPTIKMNKSRL